MNKPAHALHIYKNAMVPGLPLSVNLGDFVLVDLKMGHKLQIKCKRPMRVTETKLCLHFVVEEIYSQQKMIAHAQRLTQYPVWAKHLHASKEFQQQASYYETMTHIIKRIKVVRENRQKRSIGWMVRMETKRLHLGTAEGNGGRCAKICGRLSLRHRREKLKKKFSDL